MKVLDCTFRDGGYYNNWDFGLDVAAQYLHAISAAKVDAIEIGFRFSPKKEFIGPFGYSTDGFLKSLPLPSLPIGVMVNGSDVTSVPASQMFAPIDQSPVSRVRIALHYGKMTECEPFAKGLKDLGYEVCVNMMQTGGKSDDEIREAVRLIRSWSCASVLYFADSLGDMSPENIIHTIEVMKSEWPYAIGFHGHDNKGLALINSMAAEEAGADWVDSTILGMGRGAGNTRTEYLLTELESRGDAYVPEKVFALAMQEFTEMQREFGWGPNLLYYLSAMHNIHPTYVQEMSLMQYDAYQMLEGVKKLASAKSNSFSKQSLLNALAEDGLSVDGTWNATDWAKGRNVLVVASGPSTRKYLDSLVRFVAAKKPLVICLNCNTGFPNGCTDAYVACDYTRLSTEVHNYRKLNKPVIMPSCLAGDDLSDIEVRDYGMAVQSGQWEARTTGCTIPSILAAPYAFAALSIGKANEIYLAGFDGYESSDHRQLAMNEVFELYNGPPLLSITPTTYNVSRASVFEPRFSGV